MSSEKEQVKAEELQTISDEESSVELEDTDLEEVAGGTEDAEQISRNRRYGR